LIHEAGCRGIGIPVTFDGERLTVYFDRADRDPLSDSDAVFASCWLALKERGGCPFEGAADCFPVPPKTRSDEHVGVPVAFDDAGDLSVRVRPHSGDVVVDHARAARGSKTQPIGGSDLAYMSVAFVAVAVRAKRCPAVQLLCSLAGRYVQIAGEAAASVSE
jgi:hypothetical protein